MDTMMTFMADDAKQRIDSIQENVNLAKTTDDAEARENALTKARDDSKIVTEELSALGTAMRMRPAGIIKKLPMPPTKQHPTQRTQARYSTIFSTATEISTLSATCR